MPNELLQQDLNDAVKELAKAREEVAKNSLIMTQRLTYFTGTDTEYNTAVTAGDKARNEELRLDKLVRETALELYRLTEEKHVHEKVEIKTFGVFSLVSPAAAFKWAKDNLPTALAFDPTRTSDIRAMLLKQMPKALILNESALLDYAKIAEKSGLEKCPGVEIKSEPRAQIAKKL